MREWFKTENAKKVLIVILALFVTIAFSIKLDIINNSDISEITSNTNYFVKIILKLYYSINKDVFKSLLLFALLIIFFKKCFFREDLDKKGNRVYKIILSLLFSFFMVFGYSYMKINSWDMIFLNTFQLFKATIVFIGYYILFRGVMNYLFDQLFESIQVKETSNKLYNFIFVKHSFIIPLAIIIICWLPYLIVYYPGNLFEDPGNQLRQFFGVDLPEWSAANSTELIDENVKITNHHPVLHTVILGACAKLGMILGDVNIGIFIYTLMQFCLMACTFAYVIHYMKKLNIPDWIRTLALIIFALLPVFPIMAIRISKDEIFLCLVILYMIKIYDLIKFRNSNKLKIKEILKILVISLLICLFRNNGIFTIILSLPFIAIIDKTNRKAIIICTIVIICIYQMIMSILFPLLKIPQTGIRESLSVPFQQTARYVKEHGDEVTEEEKSVIDNILVYDTLAERYDPLLSDPVKRDYKKSATTEKLMEYFKVWFSQFLKHPTTYIEATMNNVYGYFYPESNIKHYFSYAVDSYAGANDEIDNFNYSYLDVFRVERNICQTVSRIIQKLPGVSWIMNIGLNVWVIMIIFAYLMYSKRYRYIIYLMPFVSIILMCILSPVNAAYRYAMPFVFGMPLTIAIFIDIIKNKEENNKEGKVIENEK